MDINKLGEDDRTRLRAIFTDVIQVLHDIDSLKEGAKETIKAAAEEIGVKPADLNLAIKTAYKQSLEEQKERMDTIQILLEAVGR
jgi:hypothetical protein